jgi:hypothetical protein
VLACGRPGRAGGTTRLPELAEVFGKLLAGCGPVRLNAVAQLGHGALDVELVLLQPRHVEFLAGGSALELAVNVLVVVADDSVRVSVARTTAVMGVLLGDDARCAEALGPLGDQEHASLFDRPVDVVALVRAIWKIVVGHVVDVVLQ